MPSLSNRPNGLKRDVRTNTRGNVLIKINNSIYDEYKDLRSDSKAIMDSILYLMSTDSNHLIIEGDTLEALSQHCGYTVSTIRRLVQDLTRVELLMKLSLPYEYIVNPLFAIKGRECDIWQFIQQVEYSGDVPLNVKLTCETINLTTTF